MAKTKKLTKGKGKVLKVDSADKISAMEKMLGKGSVTFVLIYADWCGACTRFKKNIWNPSCEGAAIHDRVALRDDMVKNTSLASANFDYLPSLVVVDENGKMQSFKTPEGKHTNAMPTPQSLQDMKRIVNVPVNNLAKEVPLSPAPLEENPEIPLSPSEPLTLTPESEPTSTLGKSYVPTPMVAAPMKGGRRVTMAMPKKMLKGLAGLFKRSRRRSSNSRRSSRRSSRRNGRR